MTPAPATLPANRCFSKPEGEATTMLAIRSAGRVEPGAPRPRRRSARACAMRTTGPAASPASSARCVAKLITIAAAQAQQHGIAPQNRGSAEARDGCVPQAQQAHLLTLSRARIGKGCYRFHQKLFNGCRARESPPIERFKRVSCAGRAQGLSQKLVDYDRSRLQIERSMSAAPE
jgi:hypothetical protein